MQAGKNVVVSAKETAANIGASAKSGMEKTKVTVQEKAERLTSHDPMQKEMATQKKEERRAEAEMDKRAARQHNAAAKQKQLAETARAPGKTSTGTTGIYSTTGEPGYTSGPLQMSALPKDGTGLPTGPVTEGVAPSHSVGVQHGP